MSQQTKGMISIEPKTSGGQKIQGYLSEPAAGSGSGKSPAVIVIHEWWGLVQHIKNIADRYASQGYLALAPDLYRGETATTSEEAMGLATGVSPQASASIIEDAVLYLKEKGVEGRGIGITGFCFGGTHSFNFVCESHDVAAGAIYYATRLPSDEKLEKISVPLLLVYGDQDRNVNPQQARELEGKLKRMGKRAELLEYRGCAHAFFNDESPSYKPDAARDAWDKTLRFFGQNLAHR